jgi:hypothetical protein
MFLKTKIAKVISIMQKYLLETVAGVVILGLLTNFLYDQLKATPKKSESNKSIYQNIEFNGSNNSITQEINIDNNRDKLCSSGITQYQKTIKELNMELSKAKMPEIKNIIAQDLEKAKKELTTFKKKCN